MLCARHLRDTGEEVPAITVAAGWAVCGPCVPALGDERATAAMEDRERWAEVEAEAARKADEARQRLVDLAVRQSPKGHPHVP